MGTKQWKAPHFGNGWPSAAAALTDTSMKSGARVRSWSQCIEKAVRQRFLLGARTRSSTLEWCVGLVKSSALIGLSCPRLPLTADEFTKLAFDELVRRLVHHLRARKRFDRPVESMLRRTEEVLSQPKDFVFWKTAGALGLTYRNITDAGAKNVTALIKAIRDEGARLDFASAIDPDQTGQSLKWAEDEIVEKADLNSLPA